MSNYSVFRKVDGLFIGITLSESAIEFNTPEGCEVIQGVFDYLSQRINISTGEVVDYQPPAPDDDDIRTWSWTSATKRWTSTPTLAAIKATRSAPIIAQLDAIDTKLIRPAGEITQALALGQAIPTSAATRLTALNAEKAALRQFLAAIASATAATLDAVMAAGPAV